MRIRIKEFVSAYRRFRNYGDIIRSLAKNIKPNHLILRNGIQIYGQENSSILAFTNEIFFEKAYNPDYLSIGSEDIVVDIGAHQGVFTLLAASMTRNTVYAFEPLPDNCKFIKRNIDINGFNNVRINEMAVSDSAGSGKLFLKTASSQMGTFLPPLKHQTGQNIHIDVPFTTLKQIIDDNKIEQIDFLKMDCEGAEGSILKSTPIDYLKRIKKIALEFHPNSILGQSEIYRLLESAGFIVDDSRIAKGLLYGKSGKK